MCVTFRSTLVACAVLVSSCGTDPSGEQFLAVMTGQNQTPPLPGVLSSGTASFAVTDGGIDYSIVVQNITGVTAAHIQSGAAGVQGPVIVDLYNGPTTGPIASGALVSGTITTSGLTAISMDSLKTLMRTANAYVNVRTTSSPNGEIRGQINQN